MIDARLKGNPPRELCLAKKREKFHSLSSNPLINRKAELREIKDLQSTQQTQMTAAT